MEIELNKAPCVCLEPRKVLRWVLEGKGLSWDPSNQQCGLCGCGRTASKGTMCCLVCCGSGMRVMEGHVGTHTNPCPTGKRARSWNGHTHCQHPSFPHVILIALMETEGTALVSPLCHCQGSSTGDVPGHLQTLGAALTQADKSLSHPCIHPSTFSPLVLETGRMHPPTTKPFISPHKPLDCLKKSNQ